MVNFKIAKVFCSRLLFLRTLVCFFYSCFMVNISLVRFLYCQTDDVFKYKKLVSL